MCPLHRALLEGHAIFGCYNFLVLGGFTDRYSDLKCVYHQFTPKARLALFLIPGQKVQRYKLLAYQLQGAGESDVTQGNGYITRRVSEPLLGLKMRFWAWFDPRACLASFLIRPSGVAD
jgi:hypothetical protein